MRVSSAVVVAALLLALASGREEEARVIRPKLVRAVTHHRAPLPLLRPPSARHTQLYLLFGSRLVQSIMRVALGPLIVYVCEEMGCGAASRGRLLSAYSLGYLSSQIAGGALADVIGTKLVILWASALGGICTLASASAVSAEALWMTQVLLGASQGPLFPTSIAFLAPWLPPSERAFASTMLDLGITIATLFALPFSGAIATRLGWRGAFRLYGSLALAFSVLWATVARATPESCSYCSAEECAYIARAIGNVSGTAHAKPRSSRHVRSKISQPSTIAPTSFIAASAKLLSSLAVWCIFISHMAFNFTVYFMTAWSPSFYKETFDMRPEDAKVALSLPPLLNIAMKAFVNTPLEALLRARLGCSTLFCRRFFTFTGFIGGSLCFLMLPLASTRYGATGATACFAMANAFVALHPAGFKANYMDVTRASAGVITGIGNTLASVAAYVGPNFVGYVLQHYASWAPVFGVIAALQAVAAADFLLFSTTTPVD